VIPDGWAGDGRGGAEKRGIGRAKPPAGEMGDVSEPSYTGEDTCQKGESEFEGLETAFALLEGRDGTGTAGNLLVGAADLNGFVRRFESYEFDHRLVSRYAGGLGVLSPCTPKLHQTGAALLQHGYAGEQTLEELVDPRPSARSSKGM